MNNDDDIGALCLEGSHSQHPIQRPSSPEYSKVVCRSDLPLVLFPCSEKDIKREEGEDGKE